MTNPLFRIYSFKYEKNLLAKGFAKLPCLKSAPQSKTNTNVISRQRARKCLTPLCEAFVVQKMQFW